MNRRVRPDPYRASAARPRRQRPRGRVLGWILAVLAAIAVVVLVVLLLQSRQDAGDVRAQAESQVQELQVQLRAAEARAQLNSLLAAVRADVDEAALRSQYDGIRADLQNAYEGAQGTAADTWSVLQAGLEELDASLGESATETVASIQRMLETLTARADEP